jgi:hypothetical protein
MQITIMWHAFVIMCCLWKVILRTGNATMTIIINCISLYARHLISIIATVNLAFLLHGQTANQHSWKPFICLSLKLSPWISITAVTVNPIIVYVSCSWIFLIFACRSMSMHWHVQNVMIGMCRMWWFLAILRSFLHASLLYTFSCHSSPPTIPQSSLTLSCHLFLGLPLSLIDSKFIYNTLLGILFSSILCTCPNQRNICNLIVSAGSF